MTLTVATSCRSGLKELTLSLDSGQTQARWRTGGFLALRSVHALFTSPGVGSVWSRSSMIASTALDTVRVIISPEQMTSQPALVPSHLSIHVGKAHAATASRRQVCDLGEVDGGVDRHPVGP